MVVCYNKVMGGAVVLQIEQKMEREEIGDMERNKRGEIVMEGGRERREQNVHKLMLRMNIQMFIRPPKIQKVKKLRNANNCWK